MTLTIASKHPASSQRCVCWYTVSQGKKLVEGGVATRSRSCHPAQSVKYFSQLMLALGRFLSHQRQIRNTNDIEGHGTDGRNGS
jgi:hypothetical protein